MSNPRPAATVTSLRPDEEGPTDASLVERAKRGDTFAQKMLYRRQAPAILGLARRLLGVDADARDVVQDSFVTAFERIHQLDDPEAFAAWLKAIAVRKVHRRFRARRWTSWFTLTPRQAELGLSQMVRTDAPPEVIAELALADRIMARLPAEQRIAWTLRHIEGEPLAEVARLSGCSLATAKRRVAAAQARFDAHARGVRA